MLPTMNMIFYAIVVTVGITVALPKVLKANLHAEIGSRY